jgi:adenylate cyclase
MTKTETPPLEFWNSIKDSDVRENFEAYLEKYPEGEFRSLAEIKLKAPPEAADTDRK